MFLKNAWYVGAWGTEVGRQNLLRRTLLLRLLLRQWPQRSPQKALLAGSLAA